MIQYIYIIINIFNIFSLSFLSIKTNCDKNATFRLPCRSLHQANTRVRCELENGKFIQCYVFCHNWSLSREKINYDTTKAKIRRCYIKYIIIFNNFLIY